MQLPPKSFNPNFEQDIKSSGLAGLPFSWGQSDSSLNLDDPRLTDPQRNAILGLALRDTPLAPIAPITNSDVVRFVGSSGLPSPVAGVGGGADQGATTGGT